MRKLAVVVLSIGLLAACGSSGAKEAAPSTDTAAPTTPLPADPCKSTKGAAIAASAVFYANNEKFPTTFTELVDPEGPPLLELNHLSDAAASPALTAELVSPRTIKNDDGWTLTMTGGGATEPTFECS